MQAGSGGSTTSQAGGSSTSGGGSPGSRPSSSTPTSAPASFRVGITSYRWSEPGGVTVNPQTGGALPGRSLTVEIRYPTLEGGTATETSAATPASRFGPYPVVVFAHGFETMPATYAPLLDAWVKAGFVVVSPVFPDENEVTVQQDGGFQSNAVATNLESDEVNEPADIAFVLKQVEALDSKGSGALVSGLLDMAKVALAGQSDGANVVAGLVFDSRFSAQRAELPVAPKAVAVLSGEPFQEEGDSYSASPASPPVLFVQSNADTCNPPEQAALLYADLAGDPFRWFVELLGARHLPPYIGVPPYSAIVTRVTTTFFELELGWHAKGLSGSSVTAAGTSPGLAAVYGSSLPPIPNPADLGCGPPPPLPG